MDLYHFGIKLQNINFCLRDTASLSAAMRHTIPIENLIIDFLCQLEYVGALKQKLVQDESKRSRDALKSDGMNKT